MAWAGIVDNKVAQHVKVFQTFLLFFTKMVVAHHNIISIYDIVTNRWTLHEALPAPVVTMFRMVMDNENGNYEIGILTRNDKVYKLIGKESKKTDFKINMC